MNDGNQSSTGSVTLVGIVESSGNSRAIANRLKAIGRKTEVLNADILGSISEKDKVNDRIDSEKLQEARFES